MKNEIFLFLSSIKHPCEGWWYGVGYSNVDEKQNTLLNSLDNINRKISLFYNEEDMVKNPSTFSRSIRNLDLNLRKN